MDKIKILLSGKLNLEFYAAAVQAAGAEADAQYLPEIDTSFDGLVLCGGSDIHPSRYHQLPNGAVNMDEERDKVEFALLEAYIRAGKPVLGICRGHQLINVYFGGTLIQDLPEASLHTNKTDFRTAHPVRAEKSGFLGKLYGPEFSVNSFHHQAVDQLGSGLCPAAYWNGTCIEAFEHSVLPILGVQWHPEQMCALVHRDDTVDGSEIFKYFVALCKEAKHSADH